MERKRGEVSIAVAILRQRLATIPRPRPPLSRSAGEGPGVRAARSAGEGLGVRVPPHLPPSAPAAPTNGAEEGRGKRSRGDPAPASVNVVKSTNQLPPLPQRGSGAGGEGAPSPSPLAPFLSHAAGEEGGDYAPNLPPSAPCRSHQWSGRGER